MAIFATGSVYASEEKTELISGSDVRRQKLDGRYVLWYS
jgi:hypothetical protein